MRLYLLLIAALQLASVSPTLSSPILLEGWVLCLADLDVSCRIATHLFHVTSLRACRRLFESKSQSCKTYGQNTVFFRNCYAGALLEYRYPGEGKVAYFYPYQRFPGATQGAVYGVEAATRQTTIEDPERYMEQNCLDYVGGNEQ
jgi:hypothetical protein